MARAVNDPPVFTAGFPVPVNEPGEERTPPRRPRNYLETGERRRLMWRIMPVAAVVVIGLSIAEWLWFRPRLPDPPRDIDTALEAVRGPDPTGEAVRLEIVSDEPDPFLVDAAGLSAPPAALSQVKDDTFFRDADMDAWLQTWLTLREAGMAGLARAAAPRVSFAELFGQPRSYRGRLVRFKGTLHRIEQLRAPDNNYGIDTYWQGWLEHARGPAAPIVLQFLELPAGMPVGMKVHEAVDVTGYFFKRYAYNAADTIRVAPLVMALEPKWMPISAQGMRPSSLPVWALVTMGAAVAAMLAAGRWLAQSTGRRRAEPPIDMATSLGGFEPVTPEESLRRLAATHTPDSPDIPSAENAP